MTFDWEAEVQKSRGYAVKPPEAEQKSRREKADQFLEDHNLDAVLIYGTGAINPEPFRYLSGYVHPFSKSSGLLLIPEGGESILLLTQDWHIDDAREMSWIPEVGALPMDKQQLSSRLSEVLEERGLGGSSIGIFEADTPHLFVSALKDADSSIELADGNPVWQDIVTSPSDYDIEMIRNAGTVADEGMSSAIGASGAGVSEREIGLKALGRMAQLGAEFPHGSPGPTSVALGSHSENYSNLRPFYFTGNRLKSGQMFWLDVIACYNGYYIDCDRTVSVGEPSEEQQHIYNVVNEMYHSMFEALQPGATGHDVWKAGQDVAESHDLGENVITVYFGHTTGIGLSVRPLIKEGESETIREGSLVNIEPGIYVPDIGYACIENTVYVSDSENWTINEADIGIHVV